jgi:hypothetical protein
MNELELIKKLAGIGEPNPIEELKKWADSQITNQPKIDNQAPCPTLNDFQITEFNEINTSLTKVKENLIKNLERKGINITNDILNSIEIQEIKGE